MKSATCGALSFAAVRLFLLSFAPLFPVLVPTSAAAEPSSQPAERDDGGTADAKTARTRVLVRLVEPVDEALYERTAGQLSDLSADLVSSRDDALEPTLAGRLARARELGRHSSADVVVWFEHPSDVETTVFVQVPAKGRVLVRRSGGGTDPTSSSRSAMFEAASLIVRTALVSLDFGVDIGVPTDELGVVEEPPAPAAMKAVTRSAAKPPPHGPSWRGLFEAGWSIQADGQSAVGTRAAIVGAGASRGAWFAFARFSFGLPSRFHDDVASIDVWRHGIGASVGRRMIHHGPWALDAAAGASAFVLFRSAFARDPRFTPTPVSAPWSAALNFETRVFYQVARRTFPSLGVVLGVDVLTAPPSFSYTSPVVQTRYPTWSVQPRLGFLASWQ